MVVLEVWASLFGKVLLNLFNVVIIALPFVFFDISSSAAIIAFFIFIGLFFIRNKNIHIVITSINVGILLFLAFMHNPIFGWGALALGFLGAFILLDTPKKERKTSWQCPQCQKTLKNHEIRFGLCTFCAAKIDRNH